jgi:hypothetical protein
MRPTKGNGLTSREGQPAKLLTKSTCNFSSRSTSKEAQIQRLLACLTMRPHHTHELRMLGISRSAGRILDLKKRGYDITTDRITTVDSDGYTHGGVALYTLISVPETYVQGTGNRQSLKDLL